MKILPKLYNFLLLDHRTLYYGQRLLLIKSLFCPGRLPSSIFTFWRSFLTLQTYWQSFLLWIWQLLWNFFLLILRQASIRSGGISQPSLPNMLRTFSSKTFTSTSLGMPLTSRISLLEYWAFVQNWHSILVNLFDKSEFSYQQTANSDWSSKIASDNLQIYSTTRLLASSSLLCKGSTIFIMSLLFIFSNDLFLYVAIFKPNIYQIRNTSCKVETKILHHYQLCPHATVFKNNCGVKMALLDRLFHILQGECIWF